MDFRFFDDLVSSAPEASQEFWSIKGKHSAKYYYSAKTIEKFLKNLYKILKISKIIQKCFYKI